MAQVARWRGRAHRGRRVREGRPRRRAGDSVLLDGLPERTTAWMSHRDAVVKPPPGFTVSASTTTCPVAAMEDAEDGLFSVQFHPEVVHTPRGLDVMRNFLYRAAKRAPTWTPVSIIDEAIASDPRAGREEAGRVRAVRWRRFGRRGAARPSRGRRPARRASSSTTACSGENEAEQVVETFRRNFHVELVHVDAREKFIGGAGRRDGSRAEAEDHRRALHPHLRGGREGARRRPLPRPGDAVPGRDRVRRRTEPDGSSHHQDAPQRRRTAGRRWASSSSSRCASSSRTRSVASARSSVFHRTSCSVSPSRARVSPCASSVRSRAERLEIVRQRRRHRS